MLFWARSKCAIPRSIKWDAGSRSSLALGYGLHSQIQQLGVYFAQDTNAMGNIYHPNSNLCLPASFDIVDGDVVGAIGQAIDEICEAMTPLTAEEIACQRTAGIEDPRPLEQDVAIEKGKITAYHTKLKLSFKYEGEG